MNQHNINQENSNFEKYEKILTNRRAYLNNRLENIEDQLDDPKSNDWDEKATESEGDEVMEELGLTGQDELKAIDAALSRIQNGIFGKCVSCGAAISQERLAIVPHTPFCKTCARK